MKQINTLGLTLVLLLVLAIIAVVLGVSVMWPQKFTGELETTEFQGVYRNLELDQITRVVVNRPSKSATLVRQTNGWVLEEYDNFPVDMPALEEAIRTLRQVEFGEVVSSNQEKQAALKVDQNGTEVQLFGQNGEDVLAHFFLGKQGPDFSTIFFRQADSDQVYLVDQQLRGRFDRGGRTWRNRRPFSFTTEEVVALRLAAGESGDPLSLLLDGQDRWIIEGEEELPADKAKVELVARSFAQLAADDFPEEPEADLALFGLDEPRWTFSAELADGSTRTLMVGSVEQDENRVFAKRDDSPIIYILGKFRIRNLSKTADELRLEPAADPPALED